MTRSTQSAGSRFAARAPAASQFDPHIRSGNGYDYWVASPALANGRGRSKRSAPLASDIVAPVEPSPRYYALAWQILLWLVGAALAVLIVFG